MLPKRRAEFGWPISPMDLKGGYPEFVSSWFIPMGWFPLTFALSATNLLITSGLPDSMDFYGLDGHYWNVRLLRIYKGNYKLFLLNDFMPLM